ncbi:MAG: ketoacyl-ACP synthase III [Chitinophagaceae bacterium]|nr:ketoacyl-ACP synthase III [Chitinophagaceae bacterium]
MYIKNIAHYVPYTILNNEYFTKLNGLSNEWIKERTGIMERRKASPDENTSTMAIESVKKLATITTFPLDKVDLIIGASYTPDDTIGTFAHRIQKYLKAMNSIVLTISSACSSFINAMEVVEGYFATKKSQNALIVISEHNTAFNDEKDKVSGHLWGDGSVAILVCKEYEYASIKVQEIITKGAALSGHGPDSVTLKMPFGKIQMPFGKDVFLNACNYMSSITKQILEKNNYSIKDMAYFIPHQANFRISKKVMEQLEMKAESVISNIQYLGNTGSAGSAIGLSENWNMFKMGEKIVVSVFGGGYGYGTMLLEKL